MRRILVVGYYNHNNIGDEQYKETFKHVFDNYLLKPECYKIIYIDCDLLKEIDVVEDDIIILGGGDVLNNYFLDQIIDKFKGKPNKVVAISVGLPYSDILIDTKKLDVIDYIFIRTKQDLGLFAKYFVKERVFYLPDLSYYLLDIANTTNKFLCMRYYMLNKVRMKGTKIISFSLNRHIYTQKTEELYNSIVIEFAKTVKELVKWGYYIVFLPFNTDDKVPQNRTDINMENDILFHTDVCKRLDTKTLINVMNIGYRLNARETFELHEFFNLSIPMRFHACLFSIYQNVPMIPVFTTKKIKNLLLDIKWNASYELETDLNDIPIKMESEVLLSKISYVLGKNSKSNKINNNYILNKISLSKSCKKIESDLKSSIKTVIDVLVGPYEKIDTMKVVCNESNLINILVNRIKIFMGIEQDSLVTLNFRDRIYDDKDIQNTIVSMVSYILTKGLDSKYNYGLQERMFDKNCVYNYREEWLWIIKDNEKALNDVISSDEGLFNMDFVDQNDYSKCHRSGWQYVIDNIKQLNNEKSSLYLDLSVDKTFHWKCKINEILGIIPYRKDWVGFIHHTFDTSFSENNNVVLLKNKLFQESLKCCKGLLVFSKTLRIKLIEHLKESDLIVPPIYVMCHPSEAINIELFTWGKFIKNSDKKIINVGGWLRNIFTFYNLSIPDMFSFDVGGGTNFLCSGFNNSNFEGTMRKVALKGMYMDNYYPIDTESPNFSCGSSGSIITKSCCQCNGDENNWNKHHFEHLMKLHKSVEIINHVSNKDYDNLLTQNVVFLHLVDASTVNTIIECIVRNTPIIINRNDAVVELLGEKYPLYYDDDKQNLFHMNDQINKLLANTSNIKAAHKYLYNMNKTHLRIETFMKKLVEIIDKLP